mmetsp:Transcript_16738/g.33324  ORF Transcript_16738/g.33324 Transcript_16738/m.33324 type:complete len:508 (-) Transcript_16738:54-1577(-)
MMCTPKKVNAYDGVQFHDRIRGRSRFQNKKKRRRPLVQDMINFKSIPGIASASFLILVFMFRINVLFFRRANSGLNLRSTEFSTMPLQQLEKDYRSTPTSFMNVKKKSQPVEPDETKFLLRYLKTSHEINDHIHPFVRATRNYERMSRRSSQKDRFIIFGKDTYESSERGNHREKRDHLELGRKPTPTGREIAFVHVGKASGSTVCKLFTDACHMHLPHPCTKKTKWKKSSEGLFQYLSIVPDESEVSMNVRSYYHVTYVPYQRHSSYIFAIRNPLSRVMSVFNYRHPANAMFLFSKEKLTPYGGKSKARKLYRCFPRMDDFAKGLVGESRNLPSDIVDARSVCQDLARDTLLGRIKGFEHFFFNYRRYASSVVGSDANEFFSVRTEHLWDDMTSINKILSGADDVENIPPVKPASKETENMRSYGTMPISDTHLSDLGRAAICFALRQEFVVYYEIILKSSNFSGKDVVMNMIEQSDICSDAMLNGRYKLKSHFSMTIEELWNSEN